MRPISSRGRANRNPVAAAIDKIANSSVMITVLPRYRAMASQIAV
jgi:hypothetical protein